MQTDRMTILVDPTYKASVTRRAVARGVSTSEHVRNALDSFDATSEAEEAELAALVAEVNRAIPRMQEAFDNMSGVIAALKAENDAFFADKGVA
jgi:hypothetical protein